MMLRRFIVLLAFFGCIDLKGQDITTGLFESNPLSFNPAYAIPGYNEFKNVFLRATQNNTNWYDRNLQYSKKKA